MSTTKAQVEEVVSDVETFCRYAAMEIRSFMPTGLGDWWTKEERELCALLDEIPERFRRAIVKGQKRGWANK
jgi:hypothetical protein